MVPAFCRRTTRGFTLVEIMIVVLIIGVLLAVAAPNFVRARERTRAKTCQSNLKHIEWAKDTWAVDKRVPVDQTPNWSDLVGLNAYIKFQPTCPSGGTYELRDLRSFPICSINDNNTPSDPYDDHIRQ